MWISDGSAEITTEGNRVSCKVEEASGSNVYNAYWKEGEGDTGLNKGKAYWKVTCENIKDGLFVGVTDLNKFKQGWAGKALLYGGNLSNGGCLLVGNFGPWPKSNDVLGIFVDIDDSNIKVYFDFNGRPLGLAFDVPRGTLSQAVFPTLHFSGTGSATIQKSDAFPSSTSREEEKFEGLQGHWQYSSGSFDTLGNTLKIEINGGPNSYTGSLKVLNTISVSITPCGTNMWKGHPGMTTLMGGSPEVMQLENEMTHLITGTIALNESGNLTISNGDKTSMWSRYTPQKAAVTENPFQ